MTRRSTMTTMTTLALLICSGCIGHARIEMSAAQSIDAIVAEMYQAIEEYQADLSLLDDQREAAAVNAFIARIEQADGDEELQNQEAQSLVRALAKIRADRANALRRYIIAADNVELLSDIAAGLNQIGLEQLGLNRQLERTLQEIITQGFRFAGKERSNVDGK